MNINPVTYILKPEDCPNNGKSFPLFSPESDLLYGLRRDLFFIIAKYLLKKDLSNINMVNTISYNLSKSHLDQLSQVTKALNRAKDLDGLPEDIQNLPWEICNVPIVQEFLKCRSTLRIWKKVERSISSPMDLNIWSMVENFRAGQKVPDIRSLKCLQDYRDATKGFEEWIRAHDIAEKCQKLSLSDEAITDIRALSSLTGLRELEIEQNFITDFSLLAGFKDLQKLSLSDSAIKKISFLANLQDLKILVLKENQIEDISVLANMTHLRILDVSKNCISDSSSLSALKELEELNMHSNKIQDVTVLTNLLNLKKLELQSNQITDDSSLINLKNTCSIDVSNNPIR